MEIINKIDTEKVLTLETLNNGDVFIFVGDSTPYMKCLDDCSNYHVDLATGDLYYTDCEMADYPVRKVKAKLIIEKEER
jgi:hypothetical protein